MPIPTLELHDDIEETTEPGAVTATDRAVELDALEAKGPDDKIPGTTPPVTEPAQVLQPGITEPAPAEPVGDAPPADTESVRRALAFGWTRDQVQEMQDLGILNQAVQTQMTALMQQYQQQKEQPPGGSEDQPTPAEIKAYQLTLDPEELNPKVIEALTGMNTHYGQSFMALQKRLQNTMDTINEQHTQWYDERLDDLFEMVPDEIKPLIGQGPTRELDPFGPEINRRIQVFQQMESNALIAHRNGVRRPSLKQVFNRSVNAVFADQYKQLARTELAGKLGARKTLITHPPTARKSAGGLTLSPDERATASVKAILERQGEQPDEF